MGLNKFWVIITLHQDSTWGRVEIFLTSLSYRNERLVVACWTTRIHCILFCFFSFSLDSYGHINFQRLHFSLSLSQTCLKSIFVSLLVIKLKRQIFLSSVLAHASVIIIVFGRLVLFTGIFQCSLTHYHTFSSFQWSLWVSSVDKGVNSHLLKIVLVILKV